MLQCKIFSNSDIEKLTKNVNDFLEENEISGSNIYEIIQTMTNTSESQSKVVISIFYIK